MDSHYSHIMDSAQTLSGETSANSALAKGRPKTPVLVGITDRVAILSDRVSTVTMDLNRLADEVSGPVPEVDGCGPLTGGKSANATGQLGSLYDCLCALEDHVTRLQFAADRKGGLA